MTHRDESLHSYLRAEAYYVHLHWERVSKELAAALANLEQLLETDADPQEILVIRHRVDNLRQELASAREATLRAGVDEHTDAPAQGTSVPV